MSVPSRWAAAKASLQWTDEGSPVHRAEMTLASIAVFTICVLLFFAEVGLPFSRIERALDFPG